MVAARAKNFVYAFLPLPRARRRALEAVYGYCRLADDFADDEGLSPEERAARLADLRRRLRAAVPPADGEGEPAPADGAPALPRDLGHDLDAIMVALGDAARRFGVRHRDLDLVAQGCEQDLVVTRYETFAELHAYCYQVASAVGLACLDVFGIRGDEREARGMAEDLGIAMQLTNIIRDVKEDLERDRVYLPQEDLRRFGVSEAQLRDGQVDAAFRALMAFQVQRARAYYARARGLTRLVQRRSRVCPLALASIYQALLREVERADMDVLSARVGLSAGRKLGLMAGALARGLLVP